MFDYNLPIDEFVQMKIDLKTDLVFRLIFEPIRGSVITIDFIILKLAYKLNE